MKAISALALVFAVLPACGETDSDPAAPIESAGRVTSLIDSPDSPTFSRDVAPIIYGRCAVCHRPGEAAPFSLLSYADVRKRAKQVAIVTGSRYMPPWLPAAVPGVSFHGDRSLSLDEIDILAKWAESGAPEGDPSETPALPTWTEGWQLGQPDMIVPMPRTYTVSAEGRDIYRNFAIPAPLAAGAPTRFVRAVEWRVDNRTVLHHAVLFIDRTGASRASEAEDAEPGYPGMGPGRAQVPDGQFVGWAPGKVTRSGEEGIAWKLDEHTDIVLQLHLRPSGKPEQIRVTLGLFFADEPPTRPVVSIRLMSTQIDIPAGEREYHIKDQYELPVDLRIHGIYPHAHYLGKDMHGYATLPDGTRRELFHIPSWDFNWQDEYYYAEPIELPKGSVIAMEYTFDNSADNVLNPNSPPRRVLFGEQSDDEMGELLLQVEPSREDLPELWRDFAWKVHFDDVAYFEGKAKAEPDDARWHGQLGSLAMRGGRPDEAVSRFERVVALRPGRPRPLSNLGHAYLVGGDAASAVKALGRALAIEERLLVARVDLAKALVVLGRFADAETELDRCLSEAPGQPEIHNARGGLFVAQGQVERATAEYEAALVTSPEDTEALTNLARLRLDDGHGSEAIDLCRRALARYPDEGGAHYLLGIALRARGASGDGEEGLTHLATAASLEPSNELYARALADARGGSR